jgi:plastocyanin
MRAPERPTATVLRWHGLLVRAAVAQVLLLAVAAAALRDAEAVAIGVATLVALWLLKVRKGTLGVVALGLLGANITGWMLLGAVSNLRHGEGLFETLLPSVLTVAGLTGATSAFGLLAARRWRSFEGRAHLVAIGSVALLVAAVLIAVTVGLFVEAQRPRPDDLVVAAKSVRFSPDRLEATAGEIAVFMTNDDLFWHTFTVPDLGVSLNVPVGGGRRIAFTASPGIYEFICAVPGHTQAGMRGVLIVR